MRETTTAILSSAGTLLIGYVGQALIKRWTDRMTERERREEEDRKKREQMEDSLREREPATITAQNAAWSVIVSELQKRVNEQHTRLEAVEKERNEFEKRLRDQRTYYEQRLDDLTRQHEQERDRDKNRIRELEARVAELEAKLAAQQRSPSDRTRAGEPGARGSRKDDR